VIDILDGLVNDGRIDAQIVEIVKENRNQCFAVANGSEIEIPDISVRDSQNKFSCLNSSNNSHTLFGYNFSSSSEKP
jgi:hypothetical protein